jgi:hypothetical protein
MSRVYCAVEGGGTTWVTAIALETPENIIERAEVSTLLYHLKKKL